MKKQASDQQSHDRRYQERKRAEAAKQPPKKNIASEGASQSGVTTVKETTKE
jgi:hypothetical protein